MEQTDRRIVDLLRADGRMSFTDLGKQLGLSTSAVHQRVRRLEERGVLAGYAARVDHLKVCVASPVALEELIAKVRAAANVSTRTTIVLSTPWE